MHEQNSSKEDERDPTGLNQGEIVLSKTDSRLQNDTRGNPVLPLHRKLYNIQQPGLAPGKEQHLVLPPKQPYISSLDQPLRPLDQPLRPLQPDEFRGNPVLPQHPKLYNIQQPGLAPGEEQHLVLPPKQPYIPPLDQHGDVATFTHTGYRTSQDVARHSRNEKSALNQKLSELKQQIDRLRALEAELDVPLLQMELKQQIDCNQALEAELELTQQELELTQQQLSDLHFRYQQDLEQLREQVIRRSIIVEETPIPRKLALPSTMSFQEKLETINDLICNGGYEFRTVQGLSLETGFSHGEVREILKISPYIRETFIKDKDGNALYTLSKRKPSLRERLALLQQILSVPLQAS